MFYSMHTNIFTAPPFIIGIYRPHILCYTVLLRFGDYATVLYQLTVFVIFHIQIEVTCKSVYEVCQQTTTSWR